MGDAPTPPLPRIEVVVLYRYFAIAAEMRRALRQLCEPEDIIAPRDESGLVAFFYSRPGIFLTQAYAALYVVIEGWQDLKLSDPKIDALLDSPVVALLKRFRNATYHFQKEPVSLKHLEFLGHTGAPTEEWIGSLYGEFERYFRDNTLPLPQEFKDQIEELSPMEFALAARSYWRRVFREPEAPAAPTD